MSQTPKVGQIDLDNDCVQALMQAAAQICGNPTRAIAHLAVAMYTMHKLQAPPTFKDTQYLVVQADMIWKQLDQISAANFREGGTA